MAAVDRMLGQAIPYYGMAKKALGSQPRINGKFFKSGRLTRLDERTGKPSLCQGIKQERAIEVLYMFEETGLTPKQIEDLKATVENLRQRILKLEDWN